MLAAEKQCCHSQTQYPFSEALAAAGTRVRLLRTALRNLKRHLLTLPATDHASIPHAHEEIRLTTEAYRQAWSDLKTTQSNGNKHRQEHLSMLQQRA